MPAKLRVDESFAFLFTCIEASGCKIDFNLVGNATNLQPAAARMRYTRLKKAIEGGQFADAILYQPPPVSSKLASMANQSGRGTRLWTVSPMSKEALRNETMFDEEDAEHEADEGTDDVISPSDWAARKRKASIEEPHNQRSGLFYSNELAAAQPLQNIKRKNDGVMKEAGAYTGPDYASTGPVYSRRARHKRPDGTSWTSDHDDDSYQNLFPMTGAVGWCLATPTISYADSAGITSRSFIRRQTLANNAGSLANREVPESGRRPPPFARPFGDCIEPYTSWHLNRLVPASSFSRSPTINTQVSLERNDGYPQRPNHTADQPRVHESVDSNVLGQYPMSMYDPPRSCYSSFHLTQSTQPPVVDLASVFANFRPPRRYMSPVESQHKRAPARTTNQTSGYDSSNGSVFVPQYPLASEPDVPSTIDTSPFPRRSAIRTSSRDNNHDIGTENNAGHASDLSNGKDTTRQSSNRQHSNIGSEGAIELTSRDPGANSGEQFVKALPTSMEQAHESDTAAEDSDTAHLRKEVELTADTSSKVNSEA